MKKIKKDQQATNPEANAQATQPKEKKARNSQRAKIIVICSMVVLLVAAAYLNVLLSNRQSKTTLQKQDTATVTVFGAMKSDRDAVRQQTLTYLDSIIVSESSSEDARKAAEAKKMSMIETSNEEVILENLIKARGFSDVCVTMGQENVNVMVQDSDLDSKEVAQILYIVTEETGVAATNVIIVPKS